MQQAIFLEDVLRNRDERVLRQRRLLNAFPGCALVSLTVNIPGPVKWTPETECVFSAGYSALLEALDKAGVFPVHSTRLRQDTGQEAFLLVSMKAEALKHLCCQVEQAAPWGRLLDLDVLDPEGELISRTALGEPSRGCLVCGAPGPGCASRRLHSLSELLAAFSALAHPLFSQSSLESTEME